MGKVKPKIQKTEIIFCILVLAVIAAGLLFPRTGPLVLLDELSDVAALWIICIYVTVKTVGHWKNASPGARAAGAVIAVCCATAGLWFAKDLVLDLTEGSRTVQLTEIQVSQSQAHSGIFSHHYYLTGTDQQGERIRVEISGDDYTELAGEKSVVIEYYKYTGRVGEVR